MFVVTRAPASRHTRAAARSSGQPRLRSAPDREHAARWSPTGSRGRRHRQVRADRGRGRLPPASLEVQKPRAPLWFCEAVGARGAVEQQAGQEQPRCPGPPERGHPRAARHQLPEEPTRALHGKVLGGIWAGTGKRDSAVEGARPVWRCCHLGISSMDRIFGRRHSGQRYCG